MPTATTQTANMASTANSTQISGALPRSRSTRNGAANPFKDWLTDFDCRCRNHGDPTVAQNMRFVKCVCQHMKTTTTAFKTHAMVQILAGFREILRWDVIQNQFVDGSRRAVSALQMRLLTRGLLEHLCKVVNPDEAQQPPTVREHSRQRAGHSIWDQHQDRPCTSWSTKLKPAPTPKTTPLPRICRVPQVKAKTADRGKIASWNAQKGFGFVQPDAGGDRIFCHVSQFLGSGAPTQGMSVTFTRKHDDAKNKDFAASVVPLVDGPAFAASEGAELGSVWAWNAEKGFGFVKTVAGDSIFCHTSAIEGGNALTVGAMVAFVREYDITKHKDSAADVTGPGVTFVKDTREREQPRANTPLAQSDQGLHKPKWSTATTSGSTSAGYAPRQARRTREEENACTVKVSNLPLSCTRDDLAEMFAPYMGKPRLLTSAVDHTIVFLRRRPDGMRHLAHVAGTMYLATPGQLRRLHRLEADVETVTSVELVFRFESKQAHGGPADGRHDVDQMRFYCTKARTGAYVQRARATGWNDREGGFLLYDAAGSCKGTFDDRGRDLVSRKSRGFAYVVCGSKELCEAALKAMHGRREGSHILEAHRARPRGPRQDGGEGGGGTMRHATGYGKPLPQTQKNTAITSLSWAARAATKPAMSITKREQQPILPMPHIRPSNVCALDEAAEEWSDNDDFDLDFDM